MGREVVLFKSEEKHGRATVASYLRQLADRLEAGEVVLRQGGDELTLDIPVNVVLEIKAEEETGRKKTKRSLEVEIEWLVGEMAAEPLSIA